MSFDNNKLEKVTITPFDSRGGRMIGKQITALFNPNAYSIDKAVSWMPPQSATAQSAKTERRVDAPSLTFAGGGSRVLTMELFYDITELAPEKKDVRTETDKIVKLTRIQRDLNPQRPPAVEVSWGKARTADFPFVGVVSHLNQRFTLFRSTGEALRATLTVSFTEFLDPKINLRQTDPELTTRVVKRGDSLASIASEVYRDPALWREIAEANGLDDPRRLEIGRRLTIPKL
ncbi:MAG TPA: LysM peptidoglycan-binding domain-containing protein [Blastocatellia bacterium]|nr:LysM peptidoglycan-binding domain-containing protein [Blastocatellia bacterium]